MFAVFLADRRFAFFYTLTSNGSKATVEFVTKGTGYWELRADAEAFGQGMPVCEGG